MADFVIFNMDIADATAKKKNYSQTCLLSEFEYNDTNVLVSGVYFTDTQLVGGTPIRTMTFGSILEVADVFKTTSTIYKAAQKYFAQRVTPENLIIGQVRTADTDRASALNAIVLENTNWYIVCDIDADESEAEEIMDWAEANDKYFIYLTSSSDVVASGSSDIASTAKAGNYNNTEIIFSREEDDDGDLVRHDLALASYWGALTPGTETQKFLSLTGCTAVDSDTLGTDKLNTTNLTYLFAKNCNAFIESITSRDIFAEGTAASGRFADVTRYSKWLKDELTAEVALLFVDPGTNKKIAYTDAGVQKAVNAISKILDRELLGGKLTSYTSYSTSGQPMTIPYKITAIPVSDVSTADRNARTYSGLSIEVRYSSAIHKITSNVTMVV